MGTLGGRGPDPAGTRTGAAGGITWREPARWTPGQGSARRVATHAVPAAPGPAATVAAEERELDALVASLRRR